MPSYSSDDLSSTNRKDNVDREPDERRTFQNKPVHIFQRVPELDRYEAFAVIPNNGDPKRVPRRGFYQSETDLWERVKTRVHDLIRTENHLDRLSRTGQRN